MSSYVDNNLMPNENVVEKGKVHWFILVPGSVLIVLGLASMLGSMSPIGGIMILAGIFLLAKRLRNIWYGLFCLAS